MIKYATLPDMLDERALGGGAIVYLAGRIVYLPLYLFGTFGIRSLVWNVATLGLAAMFFGVLF